MVLNIGHRGAKGYGLENTLYSFAKAMQLGCDMIEFDLRFTKDKEIVVFHDRTLKRMCGVKKKLKDLTLAEVKKLKVSGVENIPTYAEVLDFVGRKVLLDIEIKEKGMEEMVVEELKKRKLVNNVIISSFNSKILARIKYLEPRIETFYLFHRKPLRLRSIMERCNIDGIDVTYLNFSKRLLDWSRKYGFKVLVWTVNSRKRIIKYKKWGVDGIITDFPDRV
jgi:glycerophosphoryl diester phosphodiesterase